MLISKPSFSLAIILLFVSFTSAVTHAALVWTSSNQTIFDDSDVVTTGSLVYAYSVGGSSSQSVNGVTFLPAQSNRNLDYGDSNVLIHNIISTTGFGAPSTLTAGSDYATLLDSAGYETGLNNPITLTLNVTVGQTYLLQLWGSDSRQSSGGNTGTEFLTDGDQTTLFLHRPYNVSGGFGGTYATGQFTATAATEVISIVSVDPPGNESPAQMLNAFQLRDTTTPEPASAILLGFGAVGLLIRRRTSA